MKTREEEKEYVQKCFEVQQKGGILWLIERTDTNEYLCHNFEIQRTDRPTPPKYYWSKSTDIMVVSFLTREDVEEEKKYMHLTEGGCRCCGNGSKELSTRISQHEWFNKNIDTKNN